MIVGTLSISIHAPPRGATAGLGLAPLCPWHFNSRPSARGDPSLRPNSATLANYFNSRPSARGDYRRNFRCDAPPLFQFTPLREGRPAGIFDATRRPYFNSRPSARGDDGLHTLFERLPDFNSRPSARGDIAALVAFRHVEDFNSRPSARGDREFVHGAARVGISIHAPPRGATSQKNAKKGFTRFQFTPLREGRHRKKMRKRALHDFNSRPSARGDGLQCGIILSGQTFQFTPLREGRRAQYWFPVPEVFQFTPLREGRHVPVGLRLTARIFQFTPLREGRHVPVGLRLTARIFQFTPLREGRPSRTGANPGAEAISIHAPPRGAT